MNLIRAKILEKIDALPENELVEVLDFVDFLNWRQKNQEKSSSPNSESIKDKTDDDWLESDLSNLGSYEPYEWQPGELDEALPVKYVPGKGIIIIRE